MGLAGANAAPPNRELQENEDRCMRWTKWLYLRKICIVLLLFMCWANPVWARNSVLAVNVNQSLSVEVRQATRVSLANPEIADIVVISDGEIVVIGKKPGTTTLHIWADSGARYTYEVQVGSLDNASAEQIFGLLGYEDVEVSVVGGTVVLEGLVRDQGEKQRAEKIAAAYSGNVVNLLEITNPQQVRLEVRVLEIASTKAKNLGIQYGNTVQGDKENAFAMGAPGVFMFGQSVKNSQTGHAWKDFGSYADVGATISALVKNGDAEILSAPNIVTMSGEKANVLIGGELPIPVAYDNNKVSVEWKEYGIKLDIEPRVDSRDRIHSTVKAEVSNIDRTSNYTVNLNGGFVIPALRTRRAESVVEMPSGATMAIGGLISSEDSKQISRIPLLGDLPVIGKFFQHTARNKERTEIVILVTPILISEEDAPKMSGGMQAFRSKTEREPEDQSAAAARDDGDGEKTKAVKARAETEREAGRDA